MKPVIVIPTYNEADNIASLIKTLHSQRILGLHIVVVDDNSPDGTANIVEDVSQDLAVTLIKREGKLGIGSAYIRGFQEALKLGATHVFEMDADFSHNPEDVPRLLEETKKGADMVIGSRRIHGGEIIGWGPIRQFMSAGAMWFSRLVLGLKTQDVTSGFRCFKRQVLEQIDIDSIRSNGYAFQEELLYRVEQKQFIVREIPVVFKDRSKGKSKLSKKDIIEFFIVMLKLRFS